MVVIGPNLEGAKYTLAVPAYTYAAGLKDFNDIRRFGPQLNDSIYGIEPGNDGNRLVLKMLKQNQFGLGDFKLIESSEQGMLAQVERAYRDKEPIVFLAWEPHPMNMRFDLKYLNGGDAVFGPNFGGATIYTVTRKGYSAECPNMGRLLANLKFTLRGESEMMAAILDRHEQPEVAAARVAEGQSGTGAGLARGRAHLRRAAGERRAGARGAGAACRRIRAMDRRPQDSGRRRHGGGHRHHQGARHLAIRRHLDRDPRHGRRGDRAAARPARAVA